MSLTVIAWPKSKNKSRNPFQHLLYQSIEKDGQVNVVEFNPKQLLSIKGKRVLHIHWPDVFLSSAKGARFWLKLVFLRGLFVLARLRNIPIVWTAHNLKRTGQQQGDKLDKLFWPWFSRRIDGVIFMTKSSKSKAESVFSRFNSVPNAVIPHGHYSPIISHTLRDSPPAANSQPVILFFGSITNYKNVHKLLKAFVALPAQTAQLHIKGKMSKKSPDTELLNVLEAAPESVKQAIFYEDRFLDDDELFTAISDSELVVFPYSDVLNSGAAILALSVGRPILASNTSLFQELQEQVGKDWVQLIDGELDSTQLARAVEHASTLKNAGSKPDLSSFDWDGIATQTLSFYRHVLEVER